MTASRLPGSVDQLSIELGELTEDGLSGEDAESSSKVALACSSGESSDDTELTDGELSRDGVELTEDTESSDGSAVGATVADWVLVGAGATTCSAGESFESGLEADAGLCSLAAEGSLTTERLLVAESPTPTEAGELDRALNSIAAGSLGGPERAEASPNAPAASATVAVLAVIVRQRVTCFISCSSVCRKSVCRMVVRERPGPLLWDALCPGNLSARWEPPERPLRSGA